MVKNLAAIQGQLDVGCNISVTSNGWAHTTQLGHSWEEEEEEEERSAPEAAKPLWVPSQHTSHSPSPPSLNLTAPVDRRGGSDLFGGFPALQLQPI